MLLAKDVMDVQQDVPVHVKQFVSLFVRVVQVNVKAVLAVLDARDVQDALLVMALVPGVLHVLDVRAHVKVVVQLVMVDVPLVVKTIS